MSTTPGSPLKSGLLTAALAPVPLEHRAIVLGNPELQGTELWCSADHRISHGVVRWTPGTFRCPTCDACFVIVGGRGLVRYDSGEQISFAPSDVIATSEGGWATWTVAEPLLQTYHRYEPEAVLSSAPPLLVKANIFTTPLEPWPIPESAILEGHPTGAGARLWQSADTRFNNGGARWTPGTFRFNFTFDETMVILAGGGRAWFDSGEELAFGPGDMLFVPKGGWSTWTIAETLHQSFHIDASEPIKD
jgi:uncharacterized cupin superfamily protein